MIRLITYLLTLVLVSPFVCGRWYAEIDNNSYYNVMNYGANGNGASDDSKAFLSAWQDTCAAQGTPTLVIPPKRIFMVKNITLTGPCNATNINIELKGKIIAPSKDAWQSGLNVGDNSFLIVISNVNGLTINGNGGQIDGYGSTWWTCSTCQRPKLFSFESCNNLTVNNLSISNSPRAHITIDNCNNAIFSNINVQAPADSPNTDGFDIASSDKIFIQDSTVQTGDDCVAINGGSSNINITGVFCGPGHGISIGSLGKNNAHDTVEEVYVGNCTFNNTQNGARIKTVQGGTGYAKNITFEQIILIHTYNPIIINQNYQLLEEGIEVSDVTFRGFQGTSASDLAINLACSSPGCLNIKLDHIDIVSSSPSKPTLCSCSNAHGKATSTVPDCSSVLLK